MPVVKKAPMKRSALLLGPLLALTLAAPVARADVAETVEDHILPGLARFTATTATLAAIDSCEPEALQVAWGAAFDAWVGVGHLRLGPVEEEGRVLAIAFWPDPKGMGQKQTNALLAKADPAVLEPALMAEQSVAVRGLFGLERLLWPTEAATGDYPCALTHAIADDLARMAAEIDAEWRASFADHLLNPGPSSRYLTLTEARQALLTTLITGLEFNKDARLGRPLGSFDKPHPERAEAATSGRSTRNLELSLVALRSLARSLHQPISRTEAAFDRVLANVAKVDLSQVDDPTMWLKADILRQDITAVREAVMAEIAPALGAGVGFNAADGD